MQPSISELADRLRRRYDDGCFACGRRNPLGLHLDDFALEGDDVVASFQPRPEYRGTAESLHGGVAATALDEILVWAGILRAGVRAVTGRLELRYRRPLPPGGRLTVRGRVVEVRGRRLLLAGELLHDGLVAVEAEGLYLAEEDLSELLEA